MALDPVDQIGGLATLADVSKADARAEMKAVVRAFADANAVRALDLTGRTRILVGGRLYRRDTGDTQPDDGVSVIIDDAGNHWLRVVTGDAGGLTPRGTYSGATTYEFLDLVINQNSSWVYINATPGSGNAPPTLPTQSNSHWQLVAQQGTAGSATSSADVAWTGDISPAQITADQDDYNPTGLSGAAVIRHDIDAEREVRALAGGADGRWMAHANISGFKLKKPAQRASSTAANRFAGQDIDIDPGMVGLDIYDSTSSRWRPVGYRQKPLHLHLAGRVWPTIPHRPTFYADWENFQWLDPYFTFTRASIGSYLDKKGILRYAPAGVPRFHTDYTTGETGLFIEGSRTNLLPRSEEFDNAAWTKIGTTVSANSGAAPDTNATADSLIEDSSNGEHTIVSGTISTPKNVAHSFSIWIEDSAASPVGSVYLQLNAFSGNSFRVEFSLTAGTVGSAFNVGNASGATGSIRAFPGGRYRLSISGIPNASDGSNGVQASVRFLRSGSSYQGDGTSFARLFGAQLEPGAFPSSYIPTAGSAVTRAADVLVRSNADGFINATEGTLFAEVVAFHDAASVFHNFATLSDGTTAESILIFLSTSNDNIRMGVTDGGAAQADITAGNYTYGTAARIAGAYAVNNFAASRNGAAAVPDSSGTLPDMNRLNIGSHATSASQMYGIVKRAGYIPRWCDPQVLTS